MFYKVEEVFENKPEVSSQMWGGGDISTNINKNNSQEFKGSFMKEPVVGWPKIPKLMKINKGAPRYMFYGPTESRNINKSFWDCFSTLLKAF